MKSIITNFILTFIPTLISIIVANNSSLYVGIIVGLLLAIISILIYHKLNVQRKKEAIPETLATGYYLNFIEPLISRITNNTQLIEEDVIKKSSFNMEKITVTIYKCDLDELARTKNQVNKLSKFTLKDTKADKSFAIRGKIEDSNLELVDFPNTLFSLQDYLITEFGENEKMKKKHIVRFYNKLEKLINNNLKKGRTELSKIRFINP